MTWVWEGLVLMWWDNFQGWRFSPVLECSLSTYAYKEIVTTLGPSLQSVYVFAHELQKWKNMSHVIKGLFLTQYRLVDNILILGKLQIFFKNYLIVRIFLFKALCIPAQSLLDSKEHTYCTSHSLSKTVMGNDLGCHRELQFPFRFQSATLRRHSFKDGLFAAQYLQGKDCKHICRSVSIGWINDFH